MKKQWGGGDRHGWIVLWWLNTVFFTLFLILAFEKEHRANVSGLCSTLFLIRSFIWLFFKFCSKSNVEWGRVGVLQSQQQTKIIA